MPPPIMMARTARDQPYAQPAPGLSSSSMPNAIAFQVKQLQIQPLLRDQLFQPLKEAGQSAGRSGSAAFAGARSASADKLYRLKQANPAASTSRGQAPGPGNGERSLQQSGSALFMPNRVQQADTSATEPGYRILQGRPRQEPYSTQQNSARRG